MALSRREFVKWATASAAIVGASGCSTAPRRSTAGRVVVVGAGYGGATAAKYLRLWSPDIDVTLVERNPEFISCPLSNRVLAGVWELKDLTRDYGRLSAHHGVHLVRDEAVAVDPVSRRVRLGGGETLEYDRLVLSPGIELLYDDIPGLADPAQRERVPHAWKAGEQTIALRKQLEAMPDGGVFAITVPRAPFRCPPGPYERACQVAWYFKQRKPRSKVLILDANEDVQSKKTLFREAWRNRYRGIVDYLPLNALVDVDVATMTATLDFEDVRTDVLNVIPPQRAGNIARDAGVITANGRWCDVDFLTYESLAVKDVHVLGDSVMAAPQMPKSGHMANQQGKVCAAAIIALLHGDKPNPQPLLTNTCYSFVSDRDVMHVASVHAYDSGKQTMLIVPDSSGVSPEPNALEGRYAESWAYNIWDDMLA